MKVAIHYKGSFSKRWVSYCIQNDIRYVIVNCYDNNIIEQLRNCDYLLWHHHHSDAKDVILAKKILFALQQSGKGVFPNFNTGWHFDDKIGQKYLFESLEIPHIPTYVFFDKNKAISWLKTATLPKVFKLSTGAGGVNVQLIFNQSEGEKLISKSFKKGHKRIDSKKLLLDKFAKYKNGQLKLLELVKYYVKRLLYSSYSDPNNEIGYVYFQDFVDNNSSDIRVIVIANRAFAIERFTRVNDFRASGSGLIKFLDDNNIDKKVLDIAFSAADKLQSQCIAFDFVYYEEKPLIIEISYGFSLEAYDNCKGYWDNNLIWHEGKFIPQFWMIENLISPKFK